MDKSCQSSGESSITSSSSTTTTVTNNTNNPRDQYLKHLNKLSHKISKPTIITKKPIFDQTFNHNNHQPPLQSQQSQPQQQQQNLQAQPQQQQQQQQHQPPVYNINKNDFRDVVQKLTGSPAHDRISTPPPIHAPKPPSSRLQRIRPPPLAHVSNRPPHLLNNAIPAPAPPPQQPPPLLNNTSANSFNQRPTTTITPLSPLPPLPSVHAAAESPVSAYMRYLQNSFSTVDSNRQFLGFSPLAPLVSPRWNNLVAPTPQQNQQQQQFAQPPPTTAMITSHTPPPPQPQPPFQLPTSPLPFGCLNSPRSPYPLLSPSLLLSPSSFPLSPTVPVPSPRWRGL